LAKKIKTAIKLLFSLFLLWVVLSQIEITKLLTILKDVEFFPLFIAFLLFNVSKIISAFRLNYYFKEINLELDFIKNLKLYYLGMFYNLFLPGGIGGDGYKAYILNKEYHIKLSLIIQALLFDRISGLVALLFLGSGLFVFSAYAFIPFNYFSLFLFIVIYPIFYFISKKLNRFLLFFKQTTILGFFVQLIQLFSAIFILYSLNDDFVMINFLVLFLISSVVAVLPITIGGVGVRELTFLYGLKFIGYPPDLGVVFSFLFFFITMLSSLIGVLFIHSDFKN